MNNKNLPVRSFNDLMDNIFNHGLNGFLGSDFIQSQPPVNFKESESSYHIEFAVPGFTKEEINIQLDNNVLTVKGEKSVENASSDTKYKRREFSFNSFTKSMTLPEDVNLSSITASQSNGLLQVDIAKQINNENKIARSIEIS
ncbi:MAG TPA: Hsp20/alpha crystallin family protein [Saprospiraceae bacterium]|nr:Hsp20/alpha crystallin family protein [Saprospiraceae bacterium]